MMFTYKGNKRQNDPKQISISFIFI